MDDWPSPSAPPDPFDPWAVDRWLLAQEETFAELIAEKLTRIVRNAYRDFLDTLPPEEVITAAGDLYQLESIIPRWRVVVRTDLVPRLERLYLTGSIAAYTVASTTPGGEPRQQIPADEIEGWARVVNETAVQYAQTATNRLVGVGDTTFNLIRNRTAKAIEQGATNEQLKNEVQRLAGFSEFRADVVARTEVGMAYGTGDYNGMSALGQFGPVEKEWLAAIDGRTRATHRAADGQRQPMNEPFQVGSAQLMYAKQPGGPAREVIQCRCTTLYHFAGDVRPDGSIVGENIEPRPQTTRLARPPLDELNYDYKVLPETHDGIADDSWQRTADRAQRATGVWQHEFETQRAVRRVVENIRAGRPEMEGVDEVTDRLLARLGRSFDEAGDEAFLFSRDDMAKEVQLAGRWFDEQLTTNLTQQTDELFRGMVVEDGAVFLENLGDVIDLPMTSFTPNENEAELYARPRDGLNSQVRVKLLPGARTLDLAPTASGRMSKSREQIAPPGAYRVISKEIDEAGVVQLILAAL